MPVGRHGRCAEHGVCECDVGYAGIGCEHKLKTPYGCRGAWSGAKVKFGAPPGVYMVGHGAALLRQR